MEKDNEIIESIYRENLESSQEREDNFYQDNINENINE